MQIASAAQKSPERNNFLLRACRYKQDISSVAALVRQCWMTRRVLFISCCPLRQWIYQPLHLKSSLILSIFLFIWILSRALHLTKDVKEWKKSTRQAERRQQVSFKSSFGSNDGEAAISRQLEAQLREMSTKKAQRNTIDKALRSIFWQL